jgi:hypothetical protein
LNWGHGQPPIILSTTNMRFIWRSVQRTIAQLPGCKGVKAPSFVEERSYVE